MARDKRNQEGINWKALMTEDDLFKEMLRESIQQYLEAEMEEMLGAGKWERNEGRRGHRSGYYTRGLVTRVGKIELRIPQDRLGHFSTKIFDRYQRSEKALFLSLAEMYVQCVSTRKVKKIVQELSKGQCSHRPTRPSSQFSWGGRRSTQLKAAARGFMNCPRDSVLIDLNCPRDSVLIDRHGLVANLVGEIVQGIVQGTVFSSTDTASHPIILGRKALNSVESGGQGFQESKSRACGGLGWLKSVNRADLGRSR